MSGNNSSANGSVSSLVKPVVIVVIALAVVIAAYVYGGFQAPSNPEVIAAAEKKVDDAIKPVAMVEVAEASGAHVEKSGEEIVKGVCIACHGVGALGAPKIGNAGDWGPRIAQGYETLVKHATEGIRSMPARGGNAELTDYEVADAVAYMANQSGAKFDSASFKK